MTEAINLKIIVTTRFIHPHFGGMETRVEDFYDFAEATDYFRKLKEKENNGFEFSTIEIVMC